MLRQDGMASLSTLLFDTMPSTPCVMYMITFDTEDRIRYQIRVDESSHIQQQVFVSVLNTQTREFYCSIHWDFTFDFTPRSCLDLQVCMQHVFDTQGTVQN